MPARDTNQSLDGDLRVRVNDKELDKFTKKSLKETGKPYQLLIREFITSFNDNRLRIIPTKDQKKGGLYNVPGK